MPITKSEQISIEGLSKTLDKSVLSFEADTESSNWSSQVLLRVHFTDGTTQAMRLKICLGQTFGRSEVDYYLRDYVDMPQPPLVRCYEAQFDPVAGYHLLLEDLSETHHNRREAPPTLAYGLAVAEAMGRLHRHHGNSACVPDEACWQRYFNEIRPGIEPMERATEQAFLERFVAHARLLRERWSDPCGMTLLHGDLNPTNILTPKTAETPVYFLDRQPFDWSLTYGLGTYDLAYFLILWWPEETRSAHEQTLLRCWYDAFSQSGYSWEQAQTDWHLSVEQCLHVPLEWCSKPETLTKMRWLWHTQLGRIQAALASCISQKKMP